MGERMRGYVQGRDFKLCGYKIECVVSVRTTITPYVVMNVDAPIQSSKLMSFYEVLLRNT